MKKLLGGSIFALLALFFSISVVHGAGADDFIITVQTDNAGTSNNTSITLPLNGGPFNVDWENDGTFDDFGLTGSISHDYGVAGTFTIRVQGNIDRIIFNNAGDVDKVLSIDQWGSSMWTSFSVAFFGADNLVVNATDTPNLSITGDLNNAFLNATSLGGGTGNWAWDVSNIGTMDSAFRGATNFNQDITTWDPRNVTSMSQMFSGATNFNQDIGNWNTDSLITATSLFSGASNFNQDISTKPGLGNGGGDAWNTSNVRSMFSMFRGTDFNQDIGNWDTGEVINMRFMFTTATDFNQDIGNWNTSNVTDMRNMFNGANAFDQDISTKPGLGNGGGDAWNTSNVTRMSNMFDGADVFNQNIGNWDTGNITTMQTMFRSASLFNQDIGNWNTSNVTSMAFMFASASAFNQDISTKPGLGNGGGDAWDTGNVTNMALMFSSANAFDQNLGNWDVANVGNVFNMFNNVSLSRDNYDGLLIGWDAQVLQPNLNFNAGNSSYCLGDPARTNMMTSDNWAITDGVVDCNLTVTITAPTKIDNGSITDTTIQVIDDLGILAANVVVDGVSTVTTSSLSCVQTSAVEVNCTISVDSSGDLDITATNTLGQTVSATESNYVVDTVLPQVPTITVDTTPGVNNPTVTFSALDNVAIDHFELDYNLDDGGAGTGTPTTINPATSPVSLVLDPDELTNAPFVHEITVRAFDTAGNFSTVTVRFPPIVTFSAPTLISNTTINDATVTISSPAGNNLDSIVLSPGGLATHSINCPGDLGGGVFASPVTCAISDITVTGTISVSARDVVTAAIGENAQSFIIEITNPTAKIVAPTTASTGAITDTTLVITDDTAINAADISIDAVNTTGTFSVSNLNCTQITATRVECTLQIDGNEGTGDLEVTSTDVAGNTAVVTEAGYIIDMTPPSDPVTAPDLLSGSDTGASNNDNITNNTTPTLEIVCTEIGATINVFSDDPAANTNIGTHTCVGTGTEMVVIGVLEGDHNITYTETDVLGNESGPSPVLTITVDETAPSSEGIDSISDDTGTLNNDGITNDQTLTFNGTTEANASVEVFIDGVSIGTTTADSSGDWIFDHTGTTLAQNTYTVTSQTTDVAGNTGPISTGFPVEVDISGPPTPAAPDLQDASDTGPSNTDNNTNDNTPSFDIDCTEIGNIIMVFSNNPAPNTLIETHTCTTNTTETVTISPAITDGTHTITTTETDIAGNSSSPSPGTLINIDQTAPTSPTINPVDETSTEITGTAEPGATITINPLTCDNLPVVADAAGEWSCDVTTSAPLTPGTTISATATDPAGNTSTPTMTTVDDSTDTTPGPPTVEPTDGSSVAGTAVGGNVITITDPSGPTVLCTTSVLPDGTFNCNPLSPTPAVGVLLDVTQTDPNSGNTSNPTQVQVVSSSTQVFPPDVDPTDGTIITGTAQPGSTVDVIDPGTGTVLCTTTADGTTGIFSCDVTPDLANGQTVHVTATDSGGNTSDPTAVTVDTSDGDGDGVSATQEDAAINGGDGNDDGTPDRNQSNVASQTNPVGGGSSTIEVAGGTCDLIQNYNIAAENAQVSQDAAFTYPVGLFDFELYCGSVGQTTSVVIYLDQVYDTTDWTWRKIDRNTGTYSDFAGSVVFGTAPVGATTVTTVTLSLSDQGADDEDTLLNARILDPSGPGTPFVPIPFVRTGGSGSETRTYAPIVRETENGPLACRFEDRNIGRRRGLDTNQAWFRINEKDIDFEAQVVQYYETPGIGNLQEAKVVELVATADLSAFGDEASLTINCGIEDVFGIKTGQKFSVFATDEVLDSTQNESVNTEGTSIAEVSTENETPNTDTCDTHQYKHTKLKNPQRRFADLEGNHRAYGQTMFLLEYDIIHGDGDGRDDSIRLDDPITRAEIAKLLTRAGEKFVKKGECLEQNYDDVPTDTWFHPYVEALHEEDIINGKELRTYAPADLVNAAELYKFASMTFGYEYEVETKEVGQAWYQPYKFILSEDEVFPHWFDQITPQQSVTRGDVFALIANIIESQKETSRLSRFWPF